MLLNINGDTSGIHGHETMYINESYILIMNHFFSPVRSSHQNIVVTTRKSSMCVTMETIRQKCGGYTRCRPQKLTVTLMKWNADSREQLRALRFVLFDSRESFRLDAQHFSDRDTADRFHAVLSVDRFSSHTTRCT